MREQFSAWFPSNQCFVNFRQVDRPMTTETKNKTGNVKGIKWCNPRSLAFAVYFTVWWITRTENSQFNQCKTGSCTKFHQCISVLPRKNNALILCRCWPSGMKCRMVLHADTKISDKQTVSIYEPFASTHMATQCYNPADQHRHIHCRENFKNFASIFTVLKRVMKFLHWKHISLVVFVVLTAVNSQTAVLWMLEPCGVV